MFKKIDEYFNKFVEYFGMVLLVLMTIIVSWVVFTRYFLGKTPAWGEESALLCMVWFGFLSIALGVRDDTHIAIQVIDKFLTPAQERFLVILKRILIFAFSVFMIVEGFNMSKVATKNYMPGLKLNSSFLYIPVTLGGIAMVYYTITSFIKDKTREETI
ncbi:TRAP transporter small permease [Tepidanaerobacter acetatoxydans]|uniref:TRAP transporter small permease n=1 Tax=Tepidanaerobacter acetatoxydans TaxID=499229 RepID=UPI00066270BE|nr:TRAP transporter small permease [Tepidanaerobacter acetatoxydans]